MEDLVALHVSSFRHSPFFNTADHREWIFEVQQHGADATDVRGPDAVRQRQPSNARGNRMFIAGSISTLCLWYGSVKSSRSTFE